MTVYGQEVDDYSINEDALNDCSIASLHYSSDNSRSDKGKQ